ncbi:hypothetical protein LLG46_04390 [bacterium]|nr:hypothetical protein [bacterium]
MKPYVKIILVVAVFALWIALTQLSKDNGAPETGGCGCGGGTCSVAPPTNSGTR